MKSRLTRVLPVAGLLTASLAAPAAATVLDGTGGPDVLVGTHRADTIRGYGGNDVLRGKRGADHLYGGVGADQINPGDDRVKDVLHGGPGPDRIVARYFGDTVYAGKGNDTILLRTSRPTQMTSVYVHCGPGFDTIYSLWGGWGIDTASGCEVVRDY